MRDELLYFLQLHTDAELLLPLIEETRRRESWSARLVVDARLLEKFPRLRASLAQRGHAFESVTLHEIKHRRAPDLARVAAVVTATESTANPHEAAHRLTRWARRLGRVTATLQHGFENIGLTWFDEVHTPEGIRFLSDRILTWGPLELLHRDVRRETRMRCTPVGLTKAAPRTRGLLRRPGGRPHLVAIFENLHWHRFGAGDRARFLADLEAAANAFPDTTFFVRPHPAGRWLTARHQGPIPAAENVLVADPADERWDDWVGAEVFAIADGVVTTPSTIALDAARFGSATAVLAYEHDVAAYAPLPALRSTADWMEFVRSSRDAAGRARLAEQAAAFVRRVTIPGDAAARAVDQVLADVAMPRAQKLKLRARTALARVADVVKPPARRRPTAPAAIRTKVPLKGETLVVVSYWDERPLDSLVALLDQIADRASSAGGRFRVRVVANREGREGREGHDPLLLPERHHHVELLERENSGFNIGAWEHGWRTGPPFETYLFLQDECRLRRDDWLAPFLDRLSDPEVGLAGERNNPPWDRPWAEIDQRFRGHRLPGHLVDGMPVERMPAYYDFFRRHAVPLGERGDHLQTLVLAARRDVLERAGGFPIGTNYGEAIAAEIAISKRVQALGLRTVEVGPAPFHCFEHPQWAGRKKVQAAAHGRSGG